MPKTTAVISWLMKKNTQDKPDSMTPCQSVNILGVDVWVKREDLNHPIIQGNKLRKLKYNLQAATDNGYKTLVTFGGAYSNHLLATAFAANQADIPVVGVVRGDELKNNQSVWSETLYQCQQLGMQLHFVNRSEYRQKQHSSVILELINNLEQAYIIPEGGSNELAVTGMAELVSDLAKQIKPPSHIICPVGTGGTLAGIIQGVKQQSWNCQVLGVVVLKGLHSVKEDINQWLGGDCDTVKWQLINDFHCGGYAKATPELAGFCVGFTQQHDIKLDKIYNSKSFYALAQMIKNGRIQTTDTPLIVHTGGLQGGGF